MVSEIEAIGIVLGILGLGLAFYQIYLQFKDGGKKARDAKAGDPRAATAVPAEAAGARHVDPVDAAAIAEPTPYEDWFARVLATGPDGCAAVCFRLEQGDELRGEVTGLKGERFDGFVVDRANLVRCLEGESFDQYQGSERVARFAVSFRAPARGEWVLAMRLPNRLQGEFRVKLRAKKASKVRVARKDKTSSL